MKKSKNKPDHVKKQFKRFLRHYKVEYQILNSQIVILHGPFPPLTFRFNKKTISVWNRIEKKVIVLQNCNTITHLFIKLIQKQIVHPKHVLKIADRNR